MARTYKDCPAKIRFPEDYPFLDTIDRIPYTTSYVDCRTGQEIEYASWFYLDRAGVKTKKKRHHERWYWLRGEPRWFRNIYERKDRRHTTREIHKYMINPEHEVQLHSKPRMDYYW